MSEKSKNLLHKILRVKEFLVLKAVLFWVKFGPLVEKIKSNKAVAKVAENPAVLKAKGQIAKIGIFQHPKFKTYLWSGLCVLALAYAVSGVFGVKSYYTEQGASAIEEGRRMVIALPNGEIEARKKSLKRKSRKEMEEQAAAGEQPADKPAEEAPGTESPTPTEPTSIEDEILRQATGQTSEPSKPVTVSSDAVQNPLNYNIKDVRPRVIIIVTGIGLSRITTENLLSLPSQIAFGLSPYANNIEEWSSRIADLGYEILMELPFEPSNYPDSDPGPYGILIEADDESNINQMKTVLGLTKEEMVGVVAPIDEDFTSSEEKIVPVLQDIKSKKLTLFYANKPKNYFLPQTAKKLGLPLIAYDVLLDQDLSHEGIEDSIREAEKIAGEKGYVVVHANPYPITVEHLHKWLKTFEEKGLLLIPLTDILKNR